MNTSVQINKRKVCELACCVFKALPNLRCERIKHIGKLLPDGMKVLITDATELAWRACHQVGSTMLFAKEPHFTKEFPRILLAHDHFLFWIFDIVDDHRDRTVQYEVKVFARIALTEYGSFRFHRDAFAMLEKGLSIGNTLPH